MPKIKDETGKRYGKLTVMGCAGKDMWGYILWECLCDCGNKVKVRGYSLRNGNTKSCGCLREFSGKTIIEDGNRYGRLTVIRKYGSNRWGATWLCECDCGNTKVVSGHCLRAGATRSCGCLATEMRRKLCRNIQKHSVAEKNHNWRGGRICRKGGYIKVMVKDHPKSDKYGYVWEHVLVAECTLGEYLPKGSVIHHINGITNDNRIENLWWFPSQSEHTKHHRKLKLRTISDDDDSESVVDRGAVTMPQDKESMALVRQKGDFSAEY